jgi:outer membrane receptor protein involved in Fe transport
MVGGEGHLQDPFTTAHLMKAPVERYSLYGMATYDITDNMSAFLEASYGKVMAVSRGAQTRDISIRIARANPYIPLDIQQRMDATGLSSFVLARSGDDFGVARYNADNSTFRIVGGLEGRVADFADWDVYYQYGDNKYDQAMRNNRIQARFPLAVDAVGAPDGSIVCRSTLTDPGNGCVPANLFGEFNWDPAAKDYLYGAGWQSTAIKQHVVGANMQAEPFSTWAGPVSLAVGGEYREESIAGEADPISQANGWYVGNGQSVRGGVDVREAYAETVVPLAEGSPFAEMLEFNGAVRLTDYSTSGTVTTWKLGLIYEPVEWLRVRATRSRDIRAPNLLELFGSTSSAFSRVVDTDGVQYLPQVFTGGNEELEPERADTWTAGIVLSPEDLLPGLRLSADYYDIQVDEAISQVGAQTTVDRCAAGVAEFCQFVTRAADGTIEQVRNPWLNLDTLIIRGIDFEAAYSTPVFGDAQLSLRVLASYVDDYVTIDTAGAIERAGQTGVQTGALPGMPDWSGNAAMTLENGPARFSISGRFINSGIMDVTLVGPTDEGYDPSLPNSISDNHLPSRIYVDVGFGYRLLDRGDRSVELYGAIENLFDKEPPVNVYSGSGTNPFLFDTILRRFTAGIRFNY